MRISLWVRGIAVNRAIESTGQTHAAEVAAGQRFAFGKNWSDFLRGLSTQRIEAAEQSLRARLGVESLCGKSFLDVGSGSGLFSLAARRLGARVVSFDFDPDSVRCTAAVRDQFFADDPDWQIKRGSVLDRDFLASLGRFDVVYAWGVLHHTGQMWTAIDNTMPLVAPRGQLFIALYNDQGLVSRYWTAVKRVYNRCPLLRWPLKAIHAPYLFGTRWLVRAATGRLKLERGMSMWHDMIDWLGGYPFEVARPADVISCLESHGFQMQQVHRCGRRMGCNEFVAQRTTA
jgi:2-polyprenyl-6-hydroxyphenyl methylase/3-demethylubiquinone-9 3-methyltransferase